MQQYFTDIIKKVTNSTHVYEVHKIQDLWSGYGKILRMGTDSKEYPTVVVKHVCLPNQKKHPRGWNTDFSHKRKVKSYQVELSFYKQFGSSKALNQSCYFPECLAIENHNDETLMVLEDLDAIGFPGRKGKVGWKEMQSCLTWLANFHATFMNQRPKSLWKTGTYWHLETRPDELKVMNDKPLKKAAKDIDQKLKRSAFLTFVHGDAKLANFCFSRDGNKAAAVDFQYVGGGCGMKDVAYFVGSCLHEHECEQMEEKVLNFYFAELSKALKKLNSEIDFSHLEEDWRKMYPFAWADFHRFLKGWSPGHWKINSYSEKISRQVIDQLKES